MRNLNSLALIVSEISAFIRTDRQTDMARTSRLVILITATAVHLRVPIGILDLEEVGAMKSPSILVLAGDGSSSFPLAGDLISFSL